MVRRRSRLGWLCTALGLCACTVSSDEGNSFGSVTVATSVSTSGGESSSGEESSSGSGDASSGGAGSESSTSGLDGAGSGSSGGVLDESSGGGGGGQQPPTGMYSHCLTPGECVDVSLCITITPQGAMDPSTGFCSSTGCTDPAVDCDPSPGGTAMPACVPVTVNMVMQQACALDCAGGKTCPAPMTCQAVNGLGNICA